MMGNPGEARGRTRHAALLAVAIACLPTLAIAPARAGEIAVPTQEEWAGARRTVALPSGQTVGYVETGNTEGPPLILIHGYTDNSRSWSLLAPEFADHHVFAIDLRGHGASSAPECCYGLLDLASDLEGFMDAEGIAKADVVGHSLGSMTAAVFAALNPGKVERLVLVSTATNMPKASADWLWANVPGLPEPLDPDSQFMKDWYWNPTPVSPDFIDRERAESAATPKRVWTGVLEALTLTDWTPYATRITAPTLILWGDRDGLFDAATQDHVRALMPDARHETFAGHGHNMFWEIPGTVGPMIEDFLAR